MIKDYIIFQEDGLFGAKNKRGEIVIQPQYMEMQPFSCGLSLVRNHQYQYAYIDITNKQIIPFGTYSWCDPQFTCGYARVLGKGGWGIIDTLGNIIVPLKYDKIWTLQEEYLFSVKAFVDNKEHILNLNQLTKNTIFDGLTYICTYSIEEFKRLTNCDKLFIKTISNTTQLCFTYGCNIGLTAITGIPKEPIIAIVANSNGRIFPLLMEKANIGKATLSIAKATPKKTILKTTSHKNSFWEYEEEKMNDANDWSDPYGDEEVYYDVWNREDVESGLADAFENDLDTRWNND